MANLESARGLVHSQRVLLALTQKGASREASYKLVQKSAMFDWQNGGQLLDVLLADASVAAYLDKAELAELFDLAYHTRHVDAIFGRVFDEL